MSAATIPLGDDSALFSLFGARDTYRRKICESLSVDITARDGQVQVTGEEQPVTQAVEILQQMRAHIARHGSISPEEVSATIDRILGTRESSNFASIDIQNPGKKIRPRTAGQEAYARAIRTHDLTFCNGPAGTGKTYLAVALAVEALKQKQVRKLVLVRPAVEAGENLGFLPGDLQAKINPYLRPLLDALREMMDYELIKRYKEEDVIEMIPLAYMRGRTLNEAFIILDEAQNTTLSQMKMFLTRMGMGSKVVVSGDATQVDLPSGTRNGMADAMERLVDIHGCCQVTLTKADIVRHRLVQEIVRAYEEGPKRRRT